MNSIGKCIGCTMLVMGTLIGGGVLALPMVGIGSGFFALAALLGMMWLLMLVTGFLFLEVNVSLPPGENSFPSMARKTLGRSGQVATFVSYLLLLYALLAAYISGGSSLLSQLFSLRGISLSPHWGALLFAGLLGSCVFHGIKAVDLVNRCFFSAKAFFLVASLALLTPCMNPMSSLIHHGNGWYAIAAAPIFLSSFGYHILIPTIAKYLDRNVTTIRRVLIAGTSLTLLIYAYWLFELLGLIPQEQFSAFLQAQGSTGELISLITSQANNRWAGVVINGFANITITTSFLGVSMGLFDFLADALKKTAVAADRKLLMLLTFVPPTLFALFYPKGFILALEYAAVFVAFSHVMLPAMMVWKVRALQPGSSYRVRGGRELLAVVFLAGAILVIIPIVVPLLPRLH